MRLRIGSSAAVSSLRPCILHFLAHMSDRFELVAVADPSATVRDSLQRLYNLDATYADHEQLLDGAELDAVVISSPAGRSTRRRR